MEFHKDRQNVLTLSRMLSMCLGCYLSVFLASTGKFVRLRTLQKHQFIQVNIRVLKILETLHKYQTALVEFNGISELILIFPSLWVV